MHKRVYLFILLSVFMSGCYMTQGLEAADKAVSKFHKQYNAQKYAEIFDESGVEFKGIYDKQKVIASFEKIRNGMGRVVSSSRSGWAVNRSGDGAIATVNFVTEFENGEGKERFVFSVREDGVELVDYMFDSEIVKLD